MDASNHGEEGADEPLTGQRPYRVDGALLRGDVAIHALLALDVAFGLATWSRLPPRVPVHWGLSGQPDRWGPSWESALLMPAIAVAEYLVLLFIPLIDPRRKSYALFGDTLRVFRAVIALFTVGVHVAITLSSLGAGLDVDRFIRVALPLLFALLGNRFGRIRPNWFVGIRVPWTLDSEEVWARTHRLAGKLWVAAGLLGLPAAFLPAPAGTAALVALLVAATAVPVVYSWWLWRRLSVTASR